jgi:serine/threonine-protein kinase
MSITAARYGRAVALCLAGALVATACTWPMFRFGPEQTGANPFETGLSTANVAQLQEVWTAATGDDVVSSPAVQSGVVYIGSNDNRLYAFSAAGTTGCSGTPKTCAPVWRSALLGGDVVSSPALGNGRVIVASRGDRIQALDAAGSTNCSGTPKTCDPLWVTPLANDPIASPTVANSLVYVEQTSDTAFVYALDVKTGAPVWQAQPEEKTGGFVKQFGGVAVANGVAYATMPDIVSSDGEGLYAYDAAGTTNCSGTPKACDPLWIANFDYSFSDGTSPAVAGGVVYVVDSNGVLRAYDAAGITGCSGSPKRCDPLWTAPLGAVPDDVPAPAVAAGRVYVASDGTVKAFDAAGIQNCSGTPKVCTPLWTSPSLGTIGRSSPIVANGVLYLGTSTAVHALDAVHGGAPLWSSTTGGFQDSSPAVVNSVLYIGSTDNALHAYALP